MNNWKKEEQVTRQDASLILRLSLRQIDNLHNSGKIKKQKTKILTSSLINYRNEKIKNMYNIKDVALAVKTSLSTITKYFDIGIFGDSIFYFDEERYITSNTFNKLKKRPQSYNIYTIKQISEKTGISTSNLRKAHNMGLFKGYKKKSNSSKAIYYGEKLLKKLVSQRVYIPNETAFTIRQYIDKYKQYDISKPLHTLVNKKEIKTVKSKKLLYIHTADFSKKLSYLINTSLKSKKKIQLINRNFKKITQKRYLINLKGRIFLSYSLDGLKFTSRKLRIRGNLYIELSRNPIESNEQFNMLEIGLDKLKIKSRFDTFSQKYLMERAKLFGESNLIIKITEEKQMHQFIAIASNPVIIISGEYNFIVGTQRKLRNISVFKADNISIKGSIAIDSSILLPSQIIYRKIKNKKFDNFTIHYNPKLRILKFQIDEYIYTRSLAEMLNRTTFSFKRYAKRKYKFLTKINEHLNYIESHKFKTIEIERELLTDAYHSKSKILTKNKLDIPSIIKERTFLVVDKKNQNSKFVSNIISVDIAKTKKIIPYDLLVSMIKRSRHVTSASVMFSKRYFGNDNPILLYLDRLDKITTIEHDGYFLFYTYASLTHSYIDNRSIKSFLNMHVEYYNKLYNNIWTARKLTKGN